MTLTAACAFATHEIQHFEHAYAHRGEGQIPRSCPWCWGALPQHRPKDRPHADCPFCHPEDA